MATYPNSIARLVRPNAPQFTQQDNPRLQAVQRRLQSRMPGNAAAQMKKRNRSSNMKVG